MRRLIISVLLTLSLVLAGCNAVPLGGEETPARTLTPAPVPTDEPTPTPVPQLAPGLMGTGVTDAFALAEAHMSVLNGTSYTFYKNATVRYVNGTVLDRVTIHTQVAANDTRFYGIENRSGVAVRGSGTVSIWSNDERVLVARTSNNTTTYKVLQNASGGPIPEQELLFLKGRNYWIPTPISSVETRVAGQETRNGTTLYRVVATNVSNLTAFEGVWNNPRNLTVVALVDSRGLVHKYYLNYTTTLNNETVRVNKRIRYTDIGNTTVERPSWYDEAIENVSTATSKRYG